MPAASQKRISWLKFEPRVSNFPATKTATAVLVAFAIMTIFLFFYLLFKVAADSNSFVNANLMLLRKVLYFCITHFYDGQFFPTYFLLLFAKVVQSMWRALHQWAVVFGRMMSVWRNASVFETPNKV